MKKKIMRFFLMLIPLVISCQKEIAVESQWNALAFIKEGEELYKYYMNKPHLNITFPSSVDGDNLIYQNGRCNYNSFNYVVIFHNWEGHKATLLLNSGERTIKEYPIDTEGPIDLTLDLPPGNYSFKLKVEESGEWIYYKKDIIAGRNLIEIK